MKNLIILVLLAIINITAFAQEDIKVKVKDKEFYDTKAIAYVVEIPQAKFKDVERAWPKYLKSSPKEKVIEENGQFFIQNKLIEKISSDSLDINSFIKEYSGQVVLTVSFKLNGSYISDDSKDEIHYPTAEYVRDFALEEYKKAVKDELNEEKKTLDKLSSDLKTLIRENDNSKDAIKQKKREIIKLKDQITLNEMDQSSKVVQIQAQKELVYKLVNSVGDEQKDAEKKLKQIEKDFKQLQNKKESMFNKIDNLEGQIRDKEREISKNETNQKQFKLEKGDQQYIVEKVKKKLDGIK